MLRRRCRSCIALVLSLAACAALAAQVPEYDFYPEFRQWAQSAGLGGLVRSDAALERYGAKLAAEGVPTAEIDRRITLIRTKRQELENDFWNRFFTVDKPSFNTAPNAFLVSVVEKRKPGTALDVGMGEGRNALYLAKLGWDVTGFDPADKAVQLANERAAAMGLKLRTVVAPAEEFDFGKERWDLVLFSWVPPRGTVPRVVESLRPGGVVVVEGGRAWFPQNGLLKMFDALRVLHYSDERAQSDFFNRAEMFVVRLLAEKPAG